MTGTQAPAHDPAPRLSRERVLGAAIGLADAEGIEGLTIRRLASELGVGTMSVYYYVANKDEILDGMVEMVVEEMELPPANGAWKPAIRSAALSAHEVLSRHTWAASLLLSGPRIILARLRHMNAILGCLRAGGFTAEETHRAYHALDSHIMGFTLWLVGISAGVSKFGPVEGFFERLDSAALPNLAEHVQQHLRERAEDEPGEFEFGLDLILDGLERLRRN